MRKLIASVALVTAVAVGGLAVAAVNPLQLVSAKDTKTSSTQADPGSGTAAPADVAARRGHPAAKLLDRALDGLVKQGTITADQAKAVKAAVKTEVQKAGPRHHARKGLRRGAIAVSAKTIGITPQALVKELKSGKSIAQVAEANKVDPQKVIDAIVAGGTTKIDAAVKAGKLDATKAAKLKERLPELAKKIVNRVPEPRAQRPGG